MLHLRSMLVFLLIIVSQATYAGDSSDSNCCCYSTKLVANIRNAIIAPELIGVKDAEPHGKLDRGIPCLFPMGLASDELGCIAAPFYGLLGSFDARYGRVKACGCGLPLWSAGITTGYGDNCFFNGCLSPCFWFGCSCGTVNECDCCVLGLGGGYASSDDLGVIKWLCCLLPIDIGSEVKDTNKPEVADSGASK